MNSRWNAGVTQPWGITRRRVRPGEYTPDGNCLVQIASSNECCPLFILVCVNGVVKEDEYRADSRLSLAAVSNLATTRTTMAAHGCGKTSLRRRYHENLPSGCTCLVVDGLSNHLRRTAWRELGTKTKTKTRIARAKAKFSPSLCLLGTARQGRTGQDRAHSGASFLIGSWPQYWRDDSVASPPHQMEANISS